MVLASDSVIKGRLGTNDDILFTSKLPPDGDTALVSYIDALVIFTDKNDVFPIPDETESVILSVLKT